MTCASAAVNFVGRMARTSSQSVHSYRKGSHVRKICKKEPVEILKSTDTSTTESPKRIIVFDGLSCCGQRARATASVAAASSGAGLGSPSSSCGACFGA
jgi:hypothetical protein